MRALARDSSIPGPECGETSCPHSVAANQTDLLSIKASGVGQLSGQLVGALAVASASGSTCQVYEACVTLRPALFFHSILVPFVRARAALCLLARSFRLVLPAVCPDDRCRVRDVIG